MLHVLSLLTRIRSLTENLFLAFHRVIMALGSPRACMG